MGKEFVHLHLHTEFSLLDGATKIGALVDETVKRGWKAVAITDHGNMYGAMQLYAACLAKKIKPIIGCEFYICHDRFNKVGKADMGHIVLIAKNNTGYQNLLKLSGIASKEGFYYKPRIDYDCLKEHSEGIICLSACLAGHIPQLLLQGRYDEAKEFALKLNSFFAPGDFYLEIQNHGLPEQKIVIEGLTRMSKETGIPLVATNDVHYLEKADWEVQDVLMCIQMQKTIDDPNRLKFDTHEFYYKTYEEMQEALPGYEEALDRTVEIADKCDVVIRCKAHGDIHFEDGSGVDKKYILPATENFIPYYQAPNGQDNFEFLQDMTWEGLKKKYGEITPEVRERAEKELKLIHELGFVEYFLVVWDYVHYARTHGIPVGPGRGSGVGSIVAYAISITLVDPLRYDLLFERFIHRERVSMPDFDVDFDFEQRGNMIEYVKQRYSPENVSYIGTFGTMAAKNAIRDVARVMKVPYSMADKISKIIPMKPPEGVKKGPVLKYYFGKTGKPENDKFILPELVEIYNSDDTLKHVIDIAIKMEGMPRNISTHACGILIAPKPVDEFVPQIRNGDDLSTQYSMTELESLGLLKMDFLGLKNLTDIKKATEYIKQNHGVTVDFYDGSIDYNDPKTYQMIGDGKTDGVFQLESGGFKKFMKDLKPDCLEDIIAGVSMYRPGPMDFIPKFCDNKHNPDHVTYLHPCLEPVLKSTYGVIVYQEQVMKICQVMGGYNLGQADNVRRIMGKKKKDKMAYEKVKFIDGWVDPEGKKSIAGAVNLGVPREVAEEVFGQMATFASYAFNKSHAAAYAYIAFQTAYLKCYYEPEFFTAIINNRITNTEEVSHYVTFVKSEGIPILPADINKSDSYFTVKDNKIRFGLSAVRGLGVQICDAIVNERKQNGEYKDLGDFLSRTVDLNINKRVLEGMIYSGAFDCFGKTRSQLASVFEMALACAVKDKNSRLSGQFSMFGDLFSKQESIHIDYPDIKEYDTKFKLRKEKEALGIYLSGHPLEPYKAIADQMTFNAGMVAEASSGEDENYNPDYADEQVVDNNGLTDGMKVKMIGVIDEVNKRFTKTGNLPMAVLKLEDLYGTIEVMVFNKFYEQLKNDLVEEAICVVSGRLSLRPGERPIIVMDKLEFINDEKQAEEQTQSKKIVFGEGKVQEKKQRLYMQFDIENQQLKDQVFEILSGYPGDTETFVQYNRKLYSLGATVTVSPALSSELAMIVGEKNIKVI